jgi:glutathione S-transferase
MPPCAASCSSAAGNCAGEECRRRSPDGAQRNPGTEPRITRSLRAFHRAAKVLDGHLASKKFVSGDALTLADFSLGAAMNLAELAHFPIGKRISDVRDERPLPNGLRFPQRPRTGHYTRPKPRKIEGVPRRQGTRG